jgi:hypothetical protein
MSIERTIDVQTAAIEKQTVAIGEFTAAVLGLTAVIATASGNAVATTPAATANTATAKGGKKGAAKDTAAAAETPATETSATETSVTETKAETAADDGLPPGERDADFFLAHIAPTLKALADIDVKKLGAINESFGNRKAGLIEPSKWGHLLKAVKAELDSRSSEDSVI